jgi:hypothetical protein
MVVIGYLFALAHSSAKSAIDYSLSLLHSISNGTWRFGSQSVSTQSSDKQNQKSGGGFCAKRWFRIPNKGLLFAP